MHAPITSLQAVNENLMADEANCDLLRAAELGDADAQYKIGWLYAMDSWHDEIADEALKWLERAAEQGHADAQYQLGYDCCPEFERDSPELTNDPVATLKWLRAAAEQGHELAAYYMGEIHERGLIGVPQDFNEAVKWYFIGAKSNLESEPFDSIQCVTGLIDLIKQGVCQLSKEDESHIFEFIRAKVDVVRQDVVNGIPFAQHHLDCLHARGLELAEDDEHAVNSLGLVAVLIRKEVEMVRQDAEDGNRSAQRRLGNLYAQGAWVPANDEEAIKWHSLAAAEEEGCPLNVYGKVEFDSKDVEVFRRNADRCGARLQRHLGELFEKGEYSLKDGEHVECDTTEAARWYERSAKQGDALSQFKIALMYSRGEAISQSDALAAEWYARAAENGLAAAAKNFGTLYDSGRGVEQSYRLARRWFLAAARLGDETALYNLGLIYQHGQGVREDKTLAQRWYSASAKRGYVWAKIALALITEDESDLLRATESLFLEHKDVALGRMDDCVSQLDEFRERLDDLIKRSPSPDNAPRWESNWASNDGNRRHWWRRLSVTARVATTLRGILFLVGDEEDVAQARTCFDLASKNGDPVAAYYLAMLDLRNKSYSQALCQIPHHGASVIDECDFRVWRRDYSEEFLNSLELLFQELKHKIRDDKAKEERRQAEIKAKEEEHKRTLSFLTHTLNNTLSTGPETVRTVIEILGSGLYDQGQEQYKAINNMASLFPVFLFAESLLKTFKLYVSDPEQLREKWDSDRSGDATVSLVMAMALRQSIAHFVFSPNHLGQLKRLLPGQEKEAIKQVRKSFVEEMIPLEISVETAGKVFDWVKTHFGMLQVEVAADAEMRFSSNATRYMFFFAAFSELVYNALKYSDGARPIRLKWYRDGSDYCFTCVNSCPVEAGAQSTQEGSNGGLFFIDKLMSMLRESALSYTHEDGEYQALLRFDHNNFGARDG